MSNNSNSIALTNSSWDATRGLPSEILSEIFELSITLDLLEHKTDQKWSCARPVVQVLGAICSTWRQIAWATPQLWTKIDIDFKSSDIRPQIFLLKLYLGNAGNLPLELNLWWESEVNFAAAADALVDPSVDGMIEEALWKVAWLYLRSPPFLSSWLSRAPELVSLERLAINESRLANNDPIDLSTLTTLFEFDTYNLHSDVILPWRSITELHLSCVPIEICVKLFLQCPNLELCAMDGGLLEVELNDQFKPLEIDGPVVLPRLEKLIWECLGTPWEGLILQYAQMPSLRKLCWLEDPSADNNDPLLVTFCQRLPVSLHSVKLISNSPNGFPLHAMPPELAVEKIELASYAFSSTTLNTILFSLKLRIGPQPFWAFPRLKLLCIHSYGDKPILLNDEHTIQLLATLAWRAAELGRLITLHVFNVTLRWNRARFPGPLHGSENLIVREGADQTVPLWYRQLAPGAPVEFDGDYDSHSEASDSDSDSDSD